MGVQADGGVRFCAIVARVEEDYDGLDNHC